ncbi:MAG: right-handed parallel beta-helix repeat-containing protein [Kiritimatiellae bacterium]|nr:right-handed parallel beta-helix repeat-containing protein [Kiritimatiellia bacterium]
MIPIVFRLAPPAIRRRAWLAAIGIGVLGARVAAGGDYYVSPGGSDANTGASRTEPLKTIEAGLAKLQAGDRLNIEPGTYPGGTAIRGLNGTADAPIVIRSSRPGAAVIEGFEPVTGFRRRTGCDYTYETVYSERPHRFLEQATGALLTRVAGPALVETVPGSYCHEEDEGRLYVHASDSGDPNRARIRAAVGTYGIRVSGASTHLVLDGFEIRGFGAKAGIEVTRKNPFITIRNCRIHHCGIGIFIQAGRNCRVLNNHLWSIWPVHEGAAVWWSDTTLDCLGQGNLIHDCGRSGMRCYGGDKQSDENYKGTRFTGNIVYNCDGCALQYKSGVGEKYGQADHNVSWDATSGWRIHNPATNAWHNTYAEVWGRPMPASITFGPISEQPDRDWRFADPDHLDFRLQSDSPARGQGPDGTDLGAYPYRHDVFFVGLDGNDASPGTSVAAAWRTLRHAAGAVEPGQTVYLLPGTYREALVPARSGTVDAPILFRGRGREPVVLDGHGALAVGIDLSEKRHIVVENLRVTGFQKAGARMEAGARDVTVRQCILTRNAGPGVLVGASESAAVLRNTVWANSGAGIDVLPGAVDLELNSNLSSANRGAQLRIASAALEADAHIAFNNLDSGATGGPEVAAGTTAMQVAEFEGRVASARENISAAPGLQAPEQGQFEPGLGSPCLGNGMNGAPIGATDYRPDEIAVELADLTVQAVADTAATVAWTTPRHMATTRLFWGRTPALGEEIHRVHEHMLHHTVTLTGLQPGATYYYRAESVVPWTLMHDNPIPARWDLARPRRKATSPLMRFTTLSRPAQPRTLHVSRTGNDLWPGTRERPWWTLAKAGREALPGDTVLIEPGVYTDTLVPYNSGTGPDRRITFKSAGSEPVIVDGHDALPSAIRILGKDYITIEGFSFRGIRGADYGGNHGGANYCGTIWLYDADHIAIRKCLFLGSSYQTTGINANRPTDDKVRSVTVEDCVFVKNARPLMVRRQHAVVRHCVFPVSYWGNIQITDPHGKLTLRNNLFTGCIQQKMWGFGWICSAPAGAAIDSDYNGIWYQPYDTRKWIVRLTRSEPGEARDYMDGLAGLEQWRRDTANDQHTRILDDPRLQGRAKGVQEATYKGEDARLEDYALAPDSPCRGEGEHGADMGVRVGRN